LAQGDSYASTLATDAKARSPWTGVSQFLPTTRKIQQFSEGKEPPVSHKIFFPQQKMSITKRRVIFLCEFPGWCQNRVCGRCIRHFASRPSCIPSSSPSFRYAVRNYHSLNIFNVQFLKRNFDSWVAGDFLIVGLHTDPIVNQYKGSNYPIVNLHERVLSVLACKYVSEVVIGAPYVVTADLLEHFNVAAVAHGRTRLKDDPITHMVSSQLIEYKSAILYYIQKAC